MVTKEPERKKKSRKADESWWDSFIHTKFRWWNIFPVGLFVFLVWASSYEEPETVWEKPSACRSERNVPSTAQMPRRSASNPSANNGGTVIYDNNGKPHRIDATPEEIVEQLRHEIDFDDLADQADYWPDDE